MTLSGADGKEQSGASLVLSCLRLASVSRLVVLTVKSKAELASFLSDLVSATDVSFTLSGSDGKEQSGTCLSYVVSAIEVSITLSGTDCKE